MQAAKPSTRGPEATGDGVGRQPRASRSRSSSPAVGAWSHTATAVIAPSQVLS